MYSITMTESILKTKSYEFSIKIVKLYQHLSQEKKEFTLSKQLVRSGTSIWALVREAEFWQSNLDFIHKMSIALKEANETLYRLDILQDTLYINESQYKSIYPLWHEILKILISSIKTLKNKQ
jgi:four helix bundle protein